MIEACVAALIVSDETGKRLGVMGSPQKQTGNYGKVSPTGHKLCSSLFALFPLACSVTIVDWQPGAELGTCKVLLVARRTEKAGMIAYAMGV